MSMLDLVTTLGNVVEAVCSHAAVMATLVAAALWALMHPCAVIGHASNRMFRTDPTTGARTWECTRCLRQIDRVDGGWRPELDHAAKKAASTTTAPKRRRQRKTATHTATQSKVHQKPKLRVLRARDEKAS